MSFTNIYLFQPEITSGPANEHYLPFSVGCIWVYANQFDSIKENYKLKDVIWRRERQKDILDRLDNPGICAFSCYVWNENWNLTCAKRIKERWPECIIIFGGPSVNEKWNEHEFIDVAMFGEGEEAFYRVLQNILDGEDLDKFWDNPRQKDIEHYPSPYTEGFFDKIIEDNPDIMWFMMLETNRGCPYHCTFCGWGASYLNKLKSFSIERVKGDIEWAITHNIHWIFPIDANSGILRDRDVEIAWMIRRAIEDPRSKISRVTFNHAKNLNPSCFEMEQIIQEWTYGLEIAIQSMHEPTLKAVKRFNMGMNNLERAYDLCKKYGIRYYTELVLGLPLETKETYTNGLIRLLELGQHNSVKTYLATIIPNSEMDSDEYKEKYGIEVMYPKDMYRAPDERIWDDEDKSWEVIGMIKSTNTMSSQDLADCMLFSWVLSQFHYSGYSHIITQYLYHIKGIGYKDFYTKLIDMLKNNTSIGHVYLDAKEILDDYMLSGATPSSNKWHNVVALTVPESFGTRKLFDIKNEVLDFIFEVANTFDNIPKSITDLQWFAVYDFGREYPVVYDSDYDINRWTTTPCTYEISSRNSVSKQVDQMYQKFLQRTTIKNISNPVSVESTIPDEYRGKEIPLTEIINEGRVL